MSSNMREEKLLRYLKECKQKALSIYFKEFFDNFNLGTSVGQYMDKYYLCCPFCEEYIASNELYNNCPNEIYETEEKCEIYHICRNQNPGDASFPELFKHIKEFNKMIKEIEED